MAELTPEQKKAAEAKAARADFDTVGEFGARWMEKDRAKKGTYKKERQLKLDEVEKKAKAVKGLKAKKTQTLTNRGTKLIMVKGYPVSEYFASLFTDAQKEQYFTK